MIYNGATSSRPPDRQLSATSAWRGGWRGRDFVSAGLKATSYVPLEPPEPDCEESGETKDHERHHDHPQAEERGALVPRRLAHLAERGVLGADVA